METKNRSKFVSVKIREITLYSGRLFFTGLHSELFRIADKKGFHTKVVNYRGPASALLDINQKIEEGEAIEIEGKHVPIDKVASKQEALEEIL